MEQVESRCGVRQKLLLNFLTVEDQAKTSKTKHSVTWYNTVVEQRPQMQECESLKTHESTNLLENVFMKTVLFLLVFGYVS
jgi:hypothetical protein